MARNGDGLHKRGDVWHFTYADLDGRLHEKTTGEHKQPDARRVRDRELELIRQGQLPTDMASWSLEQALSDWLEYRQATKARSTLPPEKSAVRHLKAIIGSTRRLETITAADVRRYQATRRRSVGRACFHFA
jgi:hypothetical protein